MSRYQILHDDKGVALGKNACGLFLQIWQRSNDPLARKLQDAVGPDTEALLVDKKERLHSDFTAEEMVSLIEHHDFTLAECEITACIGRLQRQARTARPDDDSDLFEILTTQR